jgi:hypothetical protein
MICDLFPKMLYFFLFCFPIGICPLTSNASKMAVKEISLGTESGAEEAVSAKSACRIDLQRYQLQLIIHD